MHRMSGHTLGESVISPSLSPHDLNNDRCQNTLPRCWWMKWFTVGTRATRGSQKDREEGAFVHLLVAPGICSDLTDRFIHVSLEAAPGNTRVAF
jgi:hypothetical protein